MNKELKSIIENLQKDPKLFVTKKLLGFLSERGHIPTADVVHGSAIGPYGVIKPQEAKNDTTYIEALRLLYDIWR